MCPHNLWLDKFQYLPQSTGHSHVQQMQQLANKNNLPIISFFPYLYKIYILIVSKNY